MKVVERKLIVVYAVSGFGIAAAAAQPAMHGENRKRAMVKTGR